MHSFLKIMKDLSVYDQDNPCPKSLTVVEGEFFRHYELGAIYGFCIYNQIVDGEPWFGIMSLEEDDEFWFIPSHPMNMSSFWCNAVNETWQRVIKWYNEYLFEGWKDNESFGDSRAWVCEVKRLSCLKLSCQKDYQTILCLTLNIFKH